MTISRVSTYAVFQSTMRDMGIAQNELFNLQTQISSGRKSRDFEGIASQTEQFLDLETKIAKSSLYLENNRLIETRLEITGTVLDQVVDIAANLKNLILIRRSNAHPNSNTFNEQLNHEWQALVAQLNTASEGRYLFSGASTDIPPVDTDVFPTLAQVGVADDGYYLGSSEDMTVRIEDNVEFVYNIRANASGFQKIFAGLSMAKQGDNNNSDADLAAAFAFLEDGLQEVITAKATVNGNKVAIGDINSRHQSFKLYWQGVKEEIGNTNLIAASTQVAINQGILQASFQVFAKINSLRLADFLG